MHENISDALPQALLVPCTCSPLSTVHLAGAFVPAISAVPTTSAVHTTAPAQQGSSVLSVQEGLLGGGAAVGAMHVSSPCKWKR